MGLKRLMTELISRKSTETRKSLGVIASKQKYKIDDVALAWNMLANKEVPCIFRLSCTLKENVDKENLHKALTRILPRVPYFRVSLTKGFIWGKWMTNLTIPNIEDDEGYTNQYIPFGRKNLLFRILVKQNRIAVEFHHILTDGYGSLVFLNSLLAEYFNLMGVITTDWDNILHPGDEPDPQEFEDTFDLRYNEEVKEKPPKFWKRSFNIPIKAEPPGILYVSELTLPLKEIGEIAKKYQVTITSLLAALYIDSLAKIQEKIHKNKRRKLKPLRLRIPVNLRKIFDSKTMRNFALFVIPSINPKMEQFTLEELAVRINDFLKSNVQPDIFYRKIAQNRRKLDSLIMNTIPLPIKRFFARKGYYFVMTPYYSGTFSNLGKLSVPAQIACNIDSYNFVLGHGPVNKAKIGVLSFENKLVLSFSRVIKEPILSETFLENLASLDIKAELS